MTPDELLQERAHHLADMMEDDTDRLIVLSILTLPADFRSRHTLHARHAEIMTRLYEGFQRQLVMAYVHEMLRRHGGTT